LVAPAGDTRPLVMWLHNEPIAMYEWCRRRECVDRVARFVFVSNWQRQRFIEVYGLPPQRCDVIQNAIDIAGPIRPWPEHSRWRWRCAYVSAPFRGLDILLDAWRELSPDNAELHIWSGVGLWTRDESVCRGLLAPAHEIPNVIYHRIAPNSVVRAALRDMHFLLYPCTWNETYCLGMVEAMSAGCRVIAPCRAVLPETAAGFARIYPALEDYEQHKHLFMHVLADELAHPWAGRPDLAEAEQTYCRAVHDMEGRAREWRYLIDGLAAKGPRPLEPI
jgi:glycosyltransferase involved in cell wall biosynthesis